MVKGFVIHKQANHSQTRRNLPIIWVVIDIEALLARDGGVLLARNHRRLKSSLSRWVKKGLLVRVMRGAYTYPQHELRHKMIAVTGMIPGAVISGDAALAAQIRDWQAPPVIEVCAPGRHLPQKGFKFTRRTIPDRYRRGGVMSPILAAVDLADHTCDGLDYLMRQHNTDPVRFQKALAAFPYRRGNRRRAKVVKRSLTRPWSVAERQYHDLLDKHRIKGWTANQVLDLDGVWYKPDAAIPKLKLIMEIDGYTIHGNREAFEKDRHRQNDLVKAGWTVLRFTWAMLSEPDLIIDTVRATIKRLTR